MTTLDVDTEQFEQAKEMILNLSQVIIKAFKPIVEKFQDFFDALEPYQKFELAHPRKKPRGSLRRIRREQRNERRNSKV